MKTFSYQFVENIETTSINRDPRPYLYEDTAPIYSLNGQYAYRVFNHYNDYHTSIKPLQSGFIDVPSNHELHDIFKPQYVNTTYPFDGYEALLPPQVPKHNPIVVYEKQFHITAQEDYEYILTCLGIQPAFALFINQQFVGYSEDSFTPSRFCINEYLQENNTLQIIVFKYASSTWLEDQDYWRLSGIFRDLFIEQKHRCALDDIKIETSYQLSKQTLHITPNTTKDTHISYALYDKDTCIKEDSIINNQNNSITFTNLHGWNAEIPYLYTLYIYVMKDQVCVQTLKKEIGFRSVEIINNQILFNQRRICFKGINRHDFSPTRGRALTKQDIYNDLIQLKQDHVNAIRTSHYPAHPYFYALCDQLGFYVMSETNLETHGCITKSAPLLLKDYEANKDNPYYVPGNHSVYYSALLERTLRHYHTYKNFTCIFSFSLGNESGGGLNLHKLYKTLKQLDRRIIHYEGGWLDKNYEYSDVQSNMYQPIPEVIDYLKHATKPFLYCEFAHAMGNSFGNFDEFMDLYNTYDAYCGGFIWEMKDQNLQHNKNLVYGGAYLDFPNYKDFVCDGVYDANMQTTPKSRAMHYYYHPIQIYFTNHTIIIKNTNTFKDYLNLKYVIKTDIKQVTETFSLIACSQIEIPYTLDVSLQVHIYDGSIPFKHAQYYVFTPQHQLLDIQPTIFDGIDTVGIKSDDTLYLIDKGSGFLHAAHKNNMIIFNTPLVPCFIRAYTSNDRGAKLHKRLQAYEQACIDTATLLSIDQKVHVKKALFYQTSAQAGPASLAFTNDQTQANQDQVSITYKPQDCGKLLVELTMDANASTDLLLNFGFEMKLPTNFHRVTYHGRGPYENYVDRKDDQCIDTYSYFVDAQENPYVRPQEYGNHCDCSYINIHNDETTLHIEAVDTPLQFNYLPYSKEQLLHTNYRHLLVKEEYNTLRIASLHAGVGGDDSWGQLPHEPYLIKRNKKHTLRFLLSIH